MKTLAFLSVMSAAAVACAADPGVVSVQVRNVGSRGEITYTLASAPAVVTMDIQTNSPSGWRSIGSQHFVNATGDVNRRVDTTSGVIKWRARETWPDREIGEKGFRAVISAWSVDNPPPYMVVDLQAASAGRVKYYAKESDLVGGGVLSNDMYRTTHVVLKKITARGIPWTMGSIYETSLSPDSGGERQRAHTVVLDYDYYLGVFLVTQRQCQLGSGVTWGNQYACESDMRPSEGRGSYHALRGSADGDTTTLAEPTESSMLGKFRSLTGVDFDLPSDAEWEYACRAGIGEGYWTDGSLQDQTGWSDTGSKCYVSARLDQLARYKHNGGAIENNGESVAHYKYGSEVGPTNATAIVGTYPPNKWGLYDMMGNLREWCLDWYREDITSLNGEVVTEQYNGVNARVVRGGAFRSSARMCRPAFRVGANPKYSLWNYDDPDGFRLRAPCVAK